MAARNKLKEVLPEELAKLANNGGQKLAAERHGVTQASVSRKLTAAKYRPVTVWIAPQEKVVIVQEIAS
jgi:hypothetical protein